MRALQFMRLMVSLYLVGWLAWTPSSKLGGPWWACMLMLCAIVWVFDAIEALRRRKTGT